MSEINNKRIEDAFRKMYSNYFDDAEQIQKMVDIMMTGSIALPTPIHENWELDMKCVSTGDQK